MKTLILTAFIATSLGAVAPSSKPDTLAYQAPAHNYYQNNWMNG